MNREPFSGVLGKGVKTESEQEGHIDDSRSVKY